MNKRGIVDLSNVLWTCLMEGKDKEYGRKVLTESGKETWINSSGWGFENVMSFMKHVMEDLKLTPHQLIFVAEGKGSKAGRQALLQSYKMGRDKAPEAYAEFNKLKDLVLDQFLAVGSQVCWQDRGVEADDVIGYLAENLLGTRYVISNDKDLAQLIGPGPKDVPTRNGWSGYVHHYRMGQLDKNPFGPFNPKLIPVAIALVGDSVDKIPGARLFGQAAFEKLLVAFGEDGLKAMQHLIVKRELVRLGEDVAELKELQRVIDSADQVYLSYELGRLWTERINTLQRPLQWNVGMVKRRTKDTHETLRKYAGVVSVVHADNYEASLPRIIHELQRSPYVTLDIETSTPPESDEWVERLGKDVVDVFGSELTSLQLTFGANLNLTAYFPIDNTEADGLRNLTVAQVRDLVAKIPSHQVVTYCHNASFEVSVLFNTWGKDWKGDPDWHGFLPNVMDTAIGASYVNENVSAGLKSWSKDLLGYDQTSYEQVTTREMTKEDWVAAGAPGKLLKAWRVPVSTGQFKDSVQSIDPDTEEVTLVQGEEIFDYETGPEMVRVQLKMKHLTATEVLDYGADDTICTAALANHFNTVMELENTRHVYEMVEQYPLYLQAKGFVNGVEFSLERMREFERDDEIKYDKAWAVLRQFLIDIGYDGTVTPVYDSITPAAIKEACLIVTGQEFKTLVRTPSKLAKLLEQQADDGEWGEHEDDIRLIASIVAAGNVQALNDLVASRFSGEPVLDLASPKQVTALLYDRIGIPIKIINAVTDTEKEKVPGLQDAVSKFKRIRAGGEGVMTSEDWALVRRKAKADDTAIDTALAFDGDSLTPEAAAALKAIKDMKTVMTRRSLFYGTYWNIKHWKDGRIHAGIRQCGTVTRRFSGSLPNTTQLPKKGEGVRFRNNFMPHRKRAVVCSADFSGQELRLSAERSQDPNLLACYVGDNLKDVHSITAAGAMRLKWGHDKVGELFRQWGADLDPNSEEGEYTLFTRLRELGKSDDWGKIADDLRKSAKNVNFASIYGAMAAKLAETLIMPLEDAEVFLNARNERFPGLNDAAARAEEFCQRTGYALTLMGARRHLAEKIGSDDNWTAARAARQAWNFEIQGSAAEMTKLAMCRIWQSPEFHQMDIEFWFPVHDELVWSVGEEDAVASMKLMHDCMVAPYSTMQVPIWSSLSLGPSYGEQIECGDWFIEDRVKAALDKVFSRASEEMKQAA